MIVNFKFFHDKNYDEYNKLWIENIERIIFLPHDLPLSKQRSTIINEITHNKDILEIRFCSYRTITHNIIVNNIMTNSLSCLLIKVVLPVAQGEDSQGAVAVHLPKQRI